MGKLYKCN